MKERIEELANKVIDMPLMKWDDDVVRKAFIETFNEALELAAKECNTKVRGMCGDKCAEAIRKLKCS